MASNQPIATVVAVTGEAYARNPEGELRALKPGDVLREGDVVITRNGGQVELATTDGQLLDIQPNETVAMTVELSETTRPAPEEAVLGDATIDQVIQALEGDGDIDALLEAPAAGLGGAGGGEGNSFVRLLRITEDTDPLAFDFGGTRQGEFPEFDSTGDAFVPETIVADAEPTIGVLSLSGDAAVVEGEMATYTLSISVAPSTDLVVSVLTGHVTTDDGDLVPVSTTVTIPAGSTSATFTVSTIDDAYADDGETFTVSINGASGGGFDSIDIATGSVTTTINDQTGPDATPGPEDTATITLAGPDSVVESNDATYTVSVDRPAATDLILNVTLTHIDTDSGDIVSVPATVTIPAGATSASFDVSTFDDVITEAGENYSISISLPAVPGGGFENVVIGSGTQVTQIVDNEGAPQITIDDVSVNEDAGTATFTVSLSNASTSTVSVDYASVSGSATGGADYGNVNGTLNFAPGVLTQTITVAITDDVFAEGVENYTIELSNAVNAGIADGTGLGTITDEPTAGPEDTVTLSISGDATVVEGETATYTVSVDQAPATDLVVSVVTGHVTTDDGDLVPVSTTVTIPAGSTSATFTVSTIDDAYADNGETFTASITGSTGGGYENLVVGTSSVTTTINDQTGSDNPPGAE
ncbi:retention module-containing protein, partial [Nitrogeniibacter aestuarii]|uniref:retention module-containing protein n=1 Tax=Nitrogeniibacter aestuarii TaxID=2815343 RepID=UPI001D0F7485